ncbi:unnamed protein product, partial [Closterium sp. Yama58-4]
MPWSTLESVGDQSEFVNNLSAIFSNSIPMLAGLLSPLHFHFFLDKLAASFAPRYYATVFKAKRLSGTGAQQMLLDTHGIKTILLELPALGGLAATAAYSKYVTREMGRSEALLKVRWGDQKRCSRWCWPRRRTWWTRTARCCPMAPLLTSCARSTS